MVEVPAGQFIMGVTEDTALDFFRNWYAAHPSPNYFPAPHFSDQTPQLTFQLDGFSIDEVEVANTRYRRCVEAGFCAVIDVSTYSEYPHYETNPAYDDYPAVVSWPNAEAYCQWVGKRLPFEAEWEKAARGTDGRPYPWGLEWHDGWANLSGLPAPVGSNTLDMSPYGVLDMGGNVREWTADWYLPYPGNPRTLDDYGKHYRVIRGWTQAEIDWPTTFRIPDWDSGLAGFRCALGAQPHALDQAVVSILAYPTAVPATQHNLSRMVYVPAGEFLMGSDDVGNRPSHQYERPAHIVYLDAFYMDRYPVTAAEFAEFLNALGGYKWRCGLDCIYTLDGEKPFGLEIRSVDGRYQAGEGFEIMPLTIATWEGARDYCAWAGKRLPTEAEWEKAARGTDGRRYPWGDNWDPARPASGQRDIGTDAAPVRTHPGDVSPYGAYDMLGNVPEWVSDWYDRHYYASSPYANPQGLDSGVVHVARGHWGPVAKYGITNRGPGSGITASAALIHCARTSEFFVHGAKNKIGTGSCSLTLCVVVNLFDEE
jgi:formylglycine-generating enzyme required for sulfatase activity